MDREVLLKQLLELGDKIRLRRALLEVSQDDFAKLIAERDRVIKELEACE